MAGQTTETAAHTSWEAQASDLTTVIAGIQLAAVFLFSNSDRLGAAWLPQVLAIVLVMVFVANYAGRPIRTIRIPVPIVLYICWVLLAVISTVLGPMNPEARVTCVTLVKVAVVTCLLSIIVRTPRQLTQISVIIICSFFITVILNRDDIATIRDAMAAGILTDSSRLDGTMGNANVFGMYAVAVCWLGILLILTASGTLVRLLALPAIPLGVAIALWTQSRKAILAIPLSVAMALILFVATQPRGQSMRIWVRKHVLIITTGVGLMAIATLLVLHSPYGSRVRDLLSGKTDESAARRADMARTGMRLWTRCPILGAGLHRFRIYYGDSYSHSTPIEVLTSTGLIGLTVYFSALILLVTRIFVLTKTAIDDDVLRAGIVVAVSTLLFSLFNLFAVMHSDRLLWPLIGGFSGFVYGQESVRQANGPWTVYR